MARQHGTLKAVLVDKEKVEVTNPVKIQDLTFRDGHQSLFATRGRTEDIIPIAEEMDKVGFYSMEVWGGATFDTMHRFLGEDPWERPRTLKKYLKKLGFKGRVRNHSSKDLWVIESTTNHPHGPPIAHILKPGMKSLQISMLL